MPNLSEIEDPEIRAIGQSLTAMAGLDVEASRRVANYVARWQHDRETSQSLERFRAGRWNPFAKAPR
jgi:hypothetical protein